MQKLHNYKNGPVLTNLWTHASAELSSCGLKFFVTTVKYDGYSESTITPAADLFACALPGTHFDENFEFRFDAQRPRKLHANHVGSGLFIPNGSRYEAKRMGSASGAGFVCQIDKSAYDDIVGPGQRPPLTPYYGEVEMPMDVVERLALVCNDPSAYPLIYAESLATILITEVHRAFGGLWLGLAQGVDDEAIRLRRVLEYIEDCIDRDFGLSELAAFSGMSLSQFCHAFKKCIGSSPHRYVSRRRIAQAKLFLRTTDETIETIAAKVGFASAGGFSRLFARSLGMTPGAYRSMTM